MLVQDGPLFETSTSQVLTGRPKCAAQAIFKLDSVISSYSKETNSRGWIGRYVCLLSAFEESFCTTISCGADPCFIFLFFFSFCLVLLLLISLYSLSHVSFLFIPNRIRTKQKVYPSTWPLVTTSENPRNE